MGKSTKAASSTDSKRRLSGLAAHNVRRGKDSGAVAGDAKQAKQAKQAKKAEKQSVFAKETTTTAAAPEKKASSKKEKKKKYVQPPTATPAVVAQ
jgi:hypothetical protein